VVAGFGCRQVIGIEKAELEPAVGLEGGAGAASDGGGAPPSDGGGGESVGGARESASAPDRGASGASGAAGAPGGVGGAEPVTLCDRYCSAVTSNCQGQFAVYTSRDACLSVCEFLPAGRPGDRGVNSVECRLHAATIAPTEVPHYCPIAGPGGNGECGTNCESYCSLMGSVCAEWWSVEHAKCLRDCKALPDKGSFTTNVAGQDYRGNHVQCRLYHACASLFDDAEQHCLHAAGAAPCK
jgi:hypothetical protein